MKTEYRANQALQDQSEARRDLPREIREGLKGFPDCEECQCYPECRVDCPDHKACMQKLPEYLPSNREQARAEWGGQQGRWPVEQGEPPMLRDSLWFWLPTLTPIVLVIAWMLVAFLEPSWLVALVEYIK